MKIYKITGGKLSTNTYFIINEIDSSTIIVDPADDEDEILQYIKDQNLKVTAVLLTHGHFDHIGGVKTIQDLGAKVYMHEADVWKIKSPERISKYIGIKIKEFVPDYIINKEETLIINGYRIKTIFTPGHTKGGVCYVLDNTIFSGDTIFKDSYGRVDFIDSNFADIKTSINKIFVLEGDYQILPGHGDPTVLSYEKANNPIRNDNE